MNPIEHVLQFFTYEHLPPELAAVSQPFAGLARQLANTLPPNPETTVALRKLLESKDAAVRAVIAARSEPTEHPVVFPSKGAP